ncbi:MAG: T9SS type A sorting domain-containing protein, partial [Bacteroidota bacterium]
FDSVYFGGNAAAEKVRVTFRVDARNVTLASGQTLTLNGTFNGWCGNCAPMAKESGSDVWNLTVLLDTAKEYEFKYVVGNWVKDEKLTPGLPCVKTTDNFTNRVFKTGKADDTLDLVCWESCGPCGATSVKQFGTASLRVYPNPATGWVAVSGEAENGQICEISISDMTGREVYRSNAVRTGMEVTLPVSQLKAGSYVVTARFDNQQLQTARLQVQ